MGIYIDGLAAKCEQLVLFAHLEEFDAEEHNYRFSQGNISIVNLGKKTSAYGRLILGFQILSVAELRTPSWQHLIVRAPTPLAPWFRLMTKKERIHFLIVADEKEGRKNLKGTSIRNSILKLFLGITDALLTKSITGTSSFANSIALQRKYAQLGISTNKVTTSTITEHDFHQRTDTCQSEVIKLLYTGRIDISKGLLDIVEAIEILRQKKIACHLDIVGWDEQDGKITNTIKSRLTGLQLLDSVTFHGKKSVGAELNKYYQKSDIYLMPSHHEGFPRAIWEALAQSLPVIATSVGSIPFTLKSGCEALIIPPKKPAALAAAIEEIKSNTKLRKSLINKGFRLAKNNTIEKQIEILISKLRT
jgi:glycosyltransferase involved in cell wall biosynthesis